MENINKLTEEEIKDLRLRCIPILNPISNFEILCGLAIVLLGKILDKELVNKQRNRVRGL